MRAGVEIQLALLFPDRQPQLRYAGGKSISQVHMHMQIRAELRNSDPTISVFELRKNFRFRAVLGLGLILSFFCTPSSPPSGNGLALRDIQIHKPKSMQQYKLL